MENKPQGIGAANAGGAVAPTGSVNAVTPIAPSGSSSVQPVGGVIPVAPEPSAFEPPEPPQKRQLKKLLLRAGLIIVGLALVGGIVAGVEYLRDRNKGTNQQSASKLFENTQIPLDELTQDGVNVLGARSLVINGQLQTREGLVVTPGNEPETPAKGQIYYDEGTDQLGYYNGSRFVFVTAPEEDDGDTTAGGGIAGATGNVATGTGLTLVNNTLNNTGVLSFQGQTGAVTLTAGTGIGINGTTISNTGDATVGNEITNVVSGGGLIRVGAGTTLSPYQVALQSCPNGQILESNGSGWECGIDDGSSASYVAGDGLQLIGNEFSINSPTCAGTDKLQWNGSAFVCSADVDTDTNTTYNAIANGGLRLAGTSFGLAICTNGQILQAQAVAGQWACANPDSVGTSYTAGNGLLLNASEFSIDSPTCAGTDKLQWDGSSFQCAADIDTDTDTTYGTVSNGGLRLVGTNFGLTDTCAPGELLQAQATAGEWDCADPSGVGSSYTAGDGLQLISGTFSIDSPACAGTDKLRWTGTAFECAADVDTDTDAQTLTWVDGTRTLSISNGNSVVIPDADTDTTYSALTNGGLRLVGTEFALAVCAEGEVLKAGATSGQWACGTDGGGTSYTAGTGLSLVGAEFSNSGVLSVSGSSTIQTTGGQNPSFSFADGSAVGQIWQWDGDSWELATIAGSGDNVIGNEVTNVTSGTSGLTRSGSGTAIDPYTLGIMDCANTEILQSGGAGIWGCVSPDSVGTTYSAGNGLQLVSGTFSVNSPTCSATEKLTWNGSAFQCEEDIDTNTDAQTLTWVDGTRTLSISGGNSVVIPDSDTTYDAMTNGGLRLVSDEFALKICSEGEVLKAQATSGEWDCAADGGGTTYVAGTGLELVGGNTFNNTGVLSFTASGALVNNGTVQNPEIAFVDGTAIGHIWQWDGDSWELATIGASNDDVIGNEVTGVTGANSGLTRSGAGTSGDPYTLAIMDCANTEVLQSGGAGVWGCAAASGVGTSYNVISNGGVRLVGNNFGLIECTDGEILRAQTTAGEWDCADPSGVGTTYSAGDGLQLISGTFSIDSPTCGPTEKLTWDGDEFLCATDIDTNTDAQTLTWVDGTRTLSISNGNSVVIPDADTDTTYSALANGGLRLVGTEFALAICAEGEVLKAGATSGQWACGSDDGGTSYTAGTGLNLAGSEFSNTGILSVTGSSTIEVSAGQNPTFSFVDGSASGQVWQWDGDSWELVDIAAAGGDGVVGNEVTGVTGSNSGLVRSGSGTSGSPYTLAVNTGDGLQLSGGAVLVDSPTCSGTDKLQWTGTAFQCAADVDTDTTYGTITDGGLRLNGTNFGLAICAEGEILKAQATSGEWDCATDTDSDTTYSAGRGLTLDGGNVFNVRVQASTCGASDKITWDGTDFVCAADIDTDTTYAAGNGLQLIGGDTFAFGDGSAVGQVWQWDGDSWELATIGGSGVTSLNSLAGVLTIQGTANQITVTPSGGDTLTLATPQNIHTGATPTFAGLTLTGNLSLGTNSITGTTGGITFTNFSVDGAGNTNVGGTLDVAGLTTLNGNLTIQNGDTLTFGGEAFTSLTGNGLQEISGALTLALQASKGLEVDGNGLSLIDCGNGQILRYETTGGSWTCDDDVDGTGLVTLQIAYDNDNEIVTSNDRNITFTLADTATDSDFVVNMLGTGNQIVFQDEGTPVFTMIDGGYATFRNSTNDANAFQVQNQAGNTLLNVDTSGNNIALLGNNSSLLSTWTTTTAMSVGADANARARVRGDAVAANGYLYHIGGVDGSGSTIATVQSARLNADGSVGTWASTTALPEARRQFQAVVMNGYIYVIGGRDASNNTEDTAYYAKLNSDGTVGAWNTTTALTQSRFGHGAVAYNGHIYVLGGFNSSVAAQSTVYYAKANPDGTLGSWSTTTALPETLTNINGTIIANGYVYVSGGFDGVGYEDDVSRAKLNADGTLGSWTTQAGVLNSYLGSDENLQQYVSNGYLYVLGAEFGDSVASFPLGSDGSLGAGTALTDVGTGLTGEAAGAQANGYFYLLGGSSASDGGGTARNTVYYTSTSRVTIGGNLDLVSFSGENLNEGRTGGSLTAGDTKIVGTLEVQDIASFLRGLSVDGGLAVVGDASIKSATNSTSAFKVLTSGNSTVFNVDTTNERVGIGTNAPTAALEVNYDGRYGAKVGSTALSRYITFGYENATSVFSPSSAESTGFIGTEGLQLLVTEGNFGVQAEATGFPALVVQGASGQTADIFVAQTDGGTELMSISASGAATFQNSTDSTEAFQILNAAGTSLVNLDTLGDKITIGSVLPGDFPQVEAAIADQGGGSQIFSADLPAGVQAGELLLVFATGRFNSVHHEYPAGWTRIVHQSTGSHRTSVAYRIADGSEASVDITAPDDTHNNILTRSYRISGHDPATPPEASATNGTSDSPNPPSLTPTWGSASTSYLSYFGGGGGGPTVSTYPCPDNQNTVANSQIQYGICSEDVAGTTHDPAAFGLTGSTNWAASTVAVAPSGINYEKVDVETYGDLTLLNGSLSIAQGSLNVVGNATFQSNSDNASAFRILNQTGDSLFNIDTLNDRISIGQADGTGTLLVLDTKDTDTDPDGVDGAMYYNSFMNQFRCYIDGDWTNCGGETGGDNFKQGGNEFGSTAILGTNDNFGLDIITNGNTVASFSNTGEATFQNETDSTGAFKILSAADGSLLNVDTIANRITLGLLGDYTVSGGNTTYDSDGYRYHVFASSGTLEIDGTVEAEYLTVAGGGGGGRAGSNGGGGGAGGVILSSDTFTSGNYSVTVGGGGPGRIGATGAGTNGDNSVFNSETAIGGGGGAAGNANAAGNGGSGGGGGLSANHGTGTFGQGNDGGTGFDGEQPEQAAGGGGGAGAAGGNASANVAGNGGDGISVWGGEYVVGGGGGGGTRDSANTPGTGGNGGGGSGGADSAGSPATSNTGGGGGGGGAGSNGGNGGSGIVVVRYPLAEASFDTALHVHGDFFNSGIATFQNRIDSDTAFTILNRNGDTIFNIDNVAGQIDIGAHVLPITDDTYDLGSSTNRWRDLYLGPSSLHIGTDGNEGVVSYNTTTQTFQMDRGLSVQNQTNKSSAFRVLTAAGGNLLNVNSLDNTIGFGGLTNNQYATDFSGYTTGAGVPSGWTQLSGQSDVTHTIVEDASATGGKLLRMSTGSNSQNRGTAWSDVPVSEDMEVLMRAKTDSSNLNKLAVQVRATDTGNYYRAGMDTTSDSIMFKRVSSTNTVLDDTGGSTGGTNVWVWYRFRASGDDLMAKIWLAGSPEPSNWQLTATDSDLTSGLPSIFLGLNGGAADIDFFSTGINGDPAPSSTTGEAASVTINGDLSLGTTFGNRLFSDDFESGNFDKWDVRWDGSTEPTVQDTTKRNGKYAASIDTVNNGATPDNGGFRTGFAASNTVYARAWFNFDIHDTGTPTILGLYPEGENGGVTVYRTTSGQICAFDAVTTFAAIACSAASAAPLDTWHKLEMRVTISAGGNDTVQVWLNDTEIITPTSANLGAIDPDTVRVGNAGGSRSYIMNLDDLAVDTAPTGQSSSLNISDSLHVSGTSSFGGMLLINGNVLPDVDDTFDLGSSTQRWRDLYLGPGSLHIGTDSNEGVISYNTETDSFDFDKSLTVNGDIVATGTITYQNSADGDGVFKIVNAAGDDVINLDTGVVKTSEGFENATFPPTSIGTWTTGGNANWTRVTDESSEGSASANSGSIGNSQTTWLDLDVTIAEDGVLSFDWKVSSEDFFDRLVLCVNNDATCSRTAGFVTHIQGEVDWTNVSIPLEAGSHSIRWLYGKDSSGSSGTDEAWVDNVRINSGQNTVTFNAGATFQNDVDSSDAFKVLNADGRNLATIDSLNSKMTIGASTNFDSVTKVYGQPDIAPGGSGNLAWSPDGKYLSTAQSASPYVSVFRYNGDTLTKLPDAIPSGHEPAGGANSIAWSPDSRYMAVANNDISGTERITILKRNGDTFQKLTPTGGWPTGTGNDIAFSPDGQYLSIAHTTTPFITTYKRSGDTFTKLSNPSTLPAGTGQGVTYSPDGKHMVVAHFTTPFITVYKRSGDTFTALSLTGGTPASTGRGVTFSPDGEHLSVAHSTTPFVTIYKRSSDTFTKQSSAIAGGDEPAGTGRDVAYSPDGRYMAATNDGSPYVIMYERSGDTYTKLYNPTPTLPSGGDGLGLEFSPDGRHLGISHLISPYITLYKAGGGLSVNTNLYGSLNVSGATTISQGDLTVDGNIHSTGLVSGSTGNFAEHLNVDGMFSVNRQDNRINIDSTGLYFNNIGTIAGTGNSVLCINGTSRQVRIASATTNCNPSSARYKENIIDMPEQMGLDVINALRPVTYTYKDGDGSTKVGLIAEEVAAVLPEIVAYDEDGLPASIDYEYMVSNLILAMQQQQVQIDELREGVLSGGLVEIAGHIRVGDDTAGTATIEAGDTVVEVTFEEEYEFVPKITTGSSAFVHVKVTDKSETGFKLRIPSAQSEDIHIDWTALEVKDPESP